MNAVWRCLVVCGIGTFVLVANAVGAPARPFQWTHEWRSGALLDRPELPYTVRAPVDMVYRVWTEGQGPRLEARSYRDESVWVTIAGLTNRRRASLSELRPQIVRECRGNVTAIFETERSLLFRCKEPAVEGRPALVGMLRLDRIPATDRGPDRSNGSDAMDHIFLVMAFVPQDQDRLLDALKLQQKPLQ